MRDAIRWFKCKLIPPKNSGSKEIITHYIGYRCIIGEWIRNDDALCHTTIIDGEYKVSLVFYQAMCSSSANIFLDTKNILMWRKPVIIRGVYKGGSGGRGRGCGRGSRAMKAVESAPQEDTIMPDDSTSSSSEDEQSKGYYS